MVSFLFLYIIACIPRAEVEGGHLGVTAVRVELGSKSLLKARRIRIVLEGCKAGASGKGTLGSMASNANAWGS